MLENWPLLSLLIWLPIAGGMVVLALGERFRSAAKITALAVTLLTFYLCIPLYGYFDNTQSAMQFIEQQPWIAGLNIFYHLGIDGIALPLIVLTALMTLLVVAAGWQVIQKRVAQYLAAFLIMEGLMIGVFAALDAILFYVFFEAMLIPMFLIIGVWGGPNRIYATLKFFLYTFFGSVLFLLALIYLHLQSGGFEILEFHQLPLGATQQLWIFLAFLFAFGVKVPMFPLHTWLPDAHVEAPTGGSVILAAITLKIGAYGFLRFALPITPDACLQLSGLVIVLSLVAVVYVGFVALAQKDLKKLIAYSSIAHMGFVTLGAFVMFAMLADVAPADKTATAILGLQGAMVQMVSHGFVSAALFLCVGVLYDRMHTRLIGDYGGVANSMPVFAAFMVLFALANTGLPGTSGFVGEFLVILASFKVSLWYAIPAATTLVLGASYTLWMIKRVVFGDIANERVAALKDIDQREFGILALLAIAVIVIGVWPQPLLDVMQPSIENLVQHILQSKL
ncbi:MAG: NADH-quinone oxidoreductase subunit M [Gammaproteobacteria bacterium]|nr:NADH-quinone oxidoreductase subunit M [Gammaproteobacteria bacterium]